MSRLTDLIQQLDFMKMHWGEPENQYLADEIIDETIAELQAFKGKQEQGLLVELPVPLGSEVWTIIESTDGSGKYWLIPYRTNFVLSMLPRWGNKFFPTRSEAEEIIAKTEEKMGCKYVFKK